MFSNLVAAFMLILFISYIYLQSVSAGLPFLDDVDIEEVKILKVPQPGYEPATTDEEWAPFLRENLHEDLKFYHEHIGKTGNKLTTQMLAAQLRRLVGSETLAGRLGIVLIQSNKIYYFMSPKTGDLIKKRVRKNLDTIAEVSADLGLALPDTVFIHNVNDAPLCTMAGGCPVPVFSIFKRYDWRTNKSVDQDVLLPHMSYRLDELLFYPWKHKDPRAVFRGSMQDSMSRNSSRVRLANLSTTPEGARYLDFGFTSNSKKNFPLPSSFMRTFENMTWHAQFKFLVNADGVTASSRRGKIMQANSVPLEEDTRWIEYFARSLVPGVHFIRYTPETILSILEEYRDPNKDQELRSMANASQHFMAKFLTPVGKVRYAVKALHAYTRLFDGLERFARSFTGILPEGPTAPAPAGSRAAALDIGRALNVTDLIAALERSSPDAAGLPGRQAGQHV